MKKKHWIQWWTLDLPLRTNSYELRWEQYFFLQTDFWFLTNGQVTYPFEPPKINGKISNVNARLREMLLYISHVHRHIQTIRAAEQSRAVYISVTTRVDINNNIIIRVISPIFCAWKTSPLYSKSLHLSLNRSLNRVLWRIKDASPIPLPLSLPL
jgi:hypothetical protein